MLKTMDLKFAPNNLDAKETGYFAGIASTDALDSYNDVVAAGAFSASITRRGLTGPQCVKMLWQHDADKPVGQWLAMEQRADGLNVEGKINLRTIVGQQAYEHVKAGEVGSLSVGFRTKRREYDEDTGVRTILEADLMETSLVTFPANSGAVITAVKGLTIKEGDTIAVLAKKFAEAYEIPRRSADAALDALKAALREDPELRALKAALGIIAEKEAPAAPIITPPDYSAFAARLEQLAGSLKANA